MGFMDVRTDIGSRGVISRIGESVLSVDIPAAFLDVLSVSGSLDVTGSLSVSDDLTVSGGLNVDNSWFMVTAPSDLPTPVSGVITLLDQATYAITRAIDLSGSRLVLGRNTTILGGSSENSRIKSTGLHGSPLITSQWSAPFRNITFEADLVLDLDATGNSDQALDWFGVNFTECQEVGTIKNYNNFIMTDSSLLNSSGMVFDGTINTIAFDTCLFTGRSGQPSTLVLSSSLVSGRRVRVIYSSFINPSGSVGILVQNENTTFGINESFILDTINFSGLGTPVSGSSNLSNKAAFSNCVGIENSADLAQFFMDNNASATSTPTQYEFYKISGSTSPGPYVRKFDLTNNRATYAGSRSGFLSGIFRGFFQRWKQPGNCVQDWIEWPNSSVNGIEGQHWGGWKGGKRYRSGCGFPF